MFYILLLLVIVNIAWSADLYYKGREQNIDDKIGMSAGRYINISKLNSSASCGYEATCSTGGYDGICVSISSGCCSGTATSNLCPGSSDIQCCTKPSCSTPSGSGTCIQTSACSGTSIPGYCDGPSDIQCCIEGAASSCSTPSGSGTCVSTSSCSGISVPGYCDGPSDIQCCVKGSGSAYFGIDISSDLDSSTASCLSSSYSFIIPRGYESVGQVDPRVCNSLEAAYYGGIKTRDVYLFPCPTCGNAADQVNTLVNYLNSNCQSYWSGRIWLDIEGSQYWLGSYSANQDFYVQLKDACVSQGPCGIYSSYYQWEELFGSTSFCYGQDLPLWYAHYDNNPSFSDFSSFGCWSSPYIKQFQGDVTKCSFDVDTSYSPYAV